MLLSVGQGLVGFTKKFGSSQKKQKPVKGPPKTREEKEADLQKLEKEQVDKEMEQAQLRENMEDLNKQVQEIKIAIFYEKSAPEKAGKEEEMKFKDEQLQLQKHQYHELTE